METINAPYDLLSFLFTGGILGILGQGIRIIVGLKKLDQQRAISTEESEVFTANRLFISIFIGFLAGALAILIKWGEVLKFDKELILSLMAAGYAGADFIEGLFNTYFKKVNTTGTTQELAARTATNRPSLTARQPSRGVASIEDEVKIAILIVDGVYNPNPARLENDKEMADFGFSDMQYISLTDRFNKIISRRNPDSDGVTIDQVMGCDTVQDCIDLVTNAI